MAVSRGTHVFLGSSENLLLSEACPSIQYRTRKELLHQRSSSTRLRELQSRILEDPLVRDVIGSRQPDGWLGDTFHGTGGIESGIRILCEKGIEPSNPVLRDALVALERGTGRLSQGIGKVGAILDDLGLGGSKLIRATVCSYAGVENRPFVQEQIEGSLERLRAVARVTEVDEITETYRGKRVFREGAVWPCIYDLRLLSGTQSWRTGANMKLVVRAVRRLVDLSPIPDIHAKWKSQVVAPASFCMHAFNPALQALSPAGWFMWFHRMEILARLGVVSGVAALREQADQLRAIVQSSGGRFNVPLRHDYFRKWGAYTGLMLEPDWRKSTRRESDLTFRSLLILGKSGQAA